MLVLSNILVKFDKKSAVFFAGQEVTGWDVLCGDQVAMIYDDHNILYLSF